jgi:phosphate transport system substrate-binding protein
MRAIPTRAIATIVIAAACAALAPASSTAQEVIGGSQFSGAGSTFAYPIISRWSRGYDRWVAGGGDFPITGAGLDSPPTKPALDYEPVGSLAGTMRVKDRRADFGASDVPLNSDELTRLGLGQFPIVMGGVAVVVNLDGVGPGQIHFTGKLLADIFLGKITSWNDPAIRQLNLELKLPDAPISIVTRADGSGTTYNLTHFLAQVSPEWKTRMGVDTTLPWPTGTKARGNEGVAALVAQTKNAIGYVEFAQAVKSNLSYAAVGNPAGKFVVPSASAFNAAAASANWAAASDFDLMLTGAPGHAAYPIAATVFVLMHKQERAPQRIQATINFFKWSLEKGAKDATELGYVPLPESLVKQVKDYWRKSFGAGV